MNWYRLHRVRHFLANSIWVPPVLGMLLALVVVRVVHRIDQACGLQADVHPDSIRLLLGTLAGSMFTIIVFVCSALLIAVQLASAQLTPRIIAFVFRDRLTKTALSLFVFVFTYSLTVLIRVNDTIPVISTMMASHGFMVCLAVFLILIDHVGKELRPSGALRAVGLFGRSVIEEVYPRSLEASPEAHDVPVAARPGESRSTILSPHDGAVLAFHVQGLRTLAEKNDCVIELVPQVGDFIAAGDPIFRVYGGRTELNGDLLCQCLAVGHERTLEQDPTFSFRIMVDVACKALSPAINDPTTAVLALDQIHHLLRSVGRRCLDDERIHDASGRLRLVYRTPDWNDFVHLAVTEIRHYGAESIQVVRRLRAMLENLIESLPAVRAPLLQQELNLLNRAAVRLFIEPEDLALADVSDLQGVGGKPEKARPTRAFGDELELEEPPADSAKRR